MTARVQMGEYDAEPIRGLPERLPPGERILWQGAPEWRSLARRAFHVRKVALYFGLLLVWRIASAVADGESLQTAGSSVGALAGLGLLATGLLAGMAWLNARSTVYTITDQRVVIRFGVALTMAVNLPYRSLQTAGFKPYADGTGDLPLRVTGASEVGYMMLWPHVRPWKLGNDVEPMLRTIPDARAVAEMLGRALAVSARRTPVPLEDAVVADPRQPSAATA